MKTALRSASATLVVGLIGVALSGAAAIATPPLAAAAACDPATRAIQYLATKQMPDGSIDASLGESADYVLGASADGIDPNTLKASSGKSPFDFIAVDLGGVTPKAFSDANQLGKVIQAVVAGGHDPSSFAGQNLLAKLLSTSGPGALYNSGTGAFQDGNGGAFQAFAQAQAILGLTSAGNSSYLAPVAAVNELKSLRSTSGASKGGWQIFSVFDSNSTSMALMALTSAGDTADNDATVYSDAFGFLHTQQDPASGGFTYSTDYGTTSDPDSDALVIQALTAAGQDAASLAWTNAKGNAPTDILSFQDGTTGGFAIAHGGKLEAFATSQVAAGIRRAPFPITPSYVVGATIPAAGCPAAAAAAIPASPAPAAPALPRAGAPGAATISLLAPVTFALAAVALLLLGAGVLAALTRGASRLT